MVMMLRAPMIEMRVPYVGLVDLSFLVFFCSRRTMSKHIFRISFFLFFHRQHDHVGIFWSFFLPWLYETIARFAGVAFIQSGCITFLCHYLLAFFLYLSHSLDCLTFLFWPQRLLGYRGCFLSFIFPCPELCLIPL